MGKAAAKEGDSITGKDMHLVTTSNTPVPGYFKFEGTINEKLSSDVRIMGRPAATVGSSTSKASSGHTPLPPPPFTSFANVPECRGTIKAGSSSVMINGKAAARNGDPAMTCTEDIPVTPNGQVQASGTVIIG